MRLKCLILGLSLKESLQNEWQVCLNKLTGLLTELAVSIHDSHHPQIADVREVFNDKTAVLVCL
jgi:hypothetical protein